MKKQIRCAIYTRKSTEEGLQQDFNSLDAQREACESYIKSQKHEGWVLTKNRYDDGGYSGGTMDRPAFKQLLQDIENKRRTEIEYFAGDLIRMAKKVGVSVPVNETLYYLIKSIEKMYS